MMRKYDNIVLNIPHSSSKMLFDGWDISSVDKETNLKNLISKWTDWRTDVIFCQNKDNINPVIGEYNRFTVDYERLMNDPLENIGQGILYERYDTSERTLSDDLRCVLMKSYNKHISKLKNALNENSLLLDCHSFPSFLSDVDICIGFNDDWSKPSDDFIKEISRIFEYNNLKVGLNNPYSNSISPLCDFEYSSLMIEINKKLYMTDEVNIIYNDDSIKSLKRIISEIYNYILKDAQ